MNHQTNNHILNNKNGMHTDSSNVDKCSCMDKMIVYKKNRYLSF